MAKKTQESIKKKTTYTTHTYVHHQEMPCIRTCIPNIPTYACMYTILPSWRIVKDCGIPSLVAEALTHSCSHHTLFSCRWPAYVPPPLWEHNLHEALQEIFILRGGLKSQSHWLIWTRDFCKKQTTYWVWIYLKRFLCLDSKQDTECTVSHIPHTKLLVAVDKLGSSQERMASGCHTHFHVWAHS